MDLTINGITYYVERHQQNPNKPNLLLLHGFMGSGQRFQSAIPLLKEFANPFTIDLLGHGQTEGATSAKRYSVGHQTVDLKQLINDLFEFPPFLHGYSMGGRLALRYALAFPQTIRGLIIESTNYGLNDEQARQKRRKIDEERAEAIETDYLAFVEKWQALPIFKNETDESKSSYNPTQNIQEQQDPKQMANSLRGFGTAQMKSVKDDLSKLTRHVLILAGKSDTKYVNISREMNEQFRQNSLQVIPDAGHRVHIDQPEAFVLAVKKFIMEYSVFA